MQPARVLASFETVRRVRAGLPCALPTNAALTALQLFILGLADTDRSCVRVMCRYAWTTLTGELGFFERSEAQGAQPASAAFGRLEVRQLDAHLAGGYY